MSSTTSPRVRSGETTTDRGPAPAGDRRRPHLPTTPGGTCPSPHRRREHGPETVDPEVLFGRLLDGTLRGAIVRTAAGQTREVPVDRWLRGACPVDERVLDRTVGAVLDVGCGPGRHLHALARRGVRALGVELSAGAVRHARAGGASVVLGSIFDVAPLPGLWGTVLLLDGNVGIGGDPARLLASTGALLRPGGRLIVELEPATDLTTATIRLEAGGHVSRWFPWAWLPVQAVAATADAAGLVVAERWSDDGREFCALVAA